MAGQKEWAMIYIDHSPKSARRRRVMPVIRRRRGGATINDLIPHRGGRPEHIQQKMAEIACDPSNR